MTWATSDHPNPEVSLVWSDEFWPPKEWYEMTELALGKTGEQWDFDDLEADQAFAKKLTKEQLLLWAVCNVDGQICNGGFSQALFNSYGQLAEEAIPGLRLFGLDEFADLVDQAWNEFGIRPIPRDREVRIERLEQIEPTEEDYNRQKSFLEKALGHA